MASKVAEWQNARRGQRYPTRFMGTLMHDRRPLPITIADISRVGARLKGRDLPEIGDEVVLTATGWRSSRRSSGTTATPAASTSTGRSSRSTSSATIRSRPTPTRCASPT